jgi:hypothetical protein
MTTNAQGINKFLSVGKQSALGTPKVGGGCQYLRRRTATFGVTNNTYENDEIARHHQSTGVTLGAKKVAGKLDGLSSSLTYQLLYEQLLQADAAATAPLTIGVDCTTQATAPQFVDGSSAFLSSGLKVGDVVQFTGFTTTATANNSRNFWITDLTAGNMTGIFLDGTAVSPKAPETGSVTVTVVGKKIVVPTSGHTTNFLTFEEWYSDISKSDLWTDCQVAQIQVGIPSTGNSTFAADIVGLNVTRGTAQAQTTPTAETTTQVHSALYGHLYANGVAVTNATGVTITITDSAAPTDAVMGSSASSDIQRQRIKVNGSFTAQFNNTALETLFDAGTVISLCAVSTADSSATSNIIAFTIPTLKLLNNQPDDGEKVIVRTYQFEAEIPSTSVGGAALKFNQAIISVQDSAFA